MLTLERLKKRLKIFTGDFRDNQLTDAEKNSKEYKMVLPLMNSGFTKPQLDAVVQSLQASSGLNLSVMVSKLSSCNILSAVSKPFVVFKINQEFSSQFSSQFSSHNYPLNVPIISTWDYPRNQAIKPDGTIGNSYSGGLATSFTLCTDAEIDNLPAVQLAAVLKKYNE